MKNIEKSFPGVRALKRVSFEAKPGEIHALLGANGAGKSTLMKIMSGAYTLDSGSIEIDGREAAIDSPLDAAMAGIHCVYQEVDTALVGGLSVAENIWMDRIARGEIRWIRWGKLQQEAAELLKRLGSTVSPSVKIEELPIAHKQIVLIARALAQKAKYVIFDEPTAPLSSEESSRLFAIMRQLRAAGVGCIFITHRLPEVFSLCDRITVMRDGTNVSTHAVAETSIPRVIRDMLGKSLEEEFPKAETAVGETILEVRHIGSGTKVKDADFSVKRGEIVGIVGLVGAGKTELSRALFGADKLDSGSMLLRGAEVRFQEPREAVRAGIVLVPEERRKQGIFIEESIQHNLTASVMSLFSRFGFQSAAKERMHAGEMVEKVGIKTPSINQSVKLLSGGNQQKVAVGKWLPTNADVFIFDEPTKGVDIGAKSDIFRLIGSLAGAGKGIVYLSAEIPEVLGLADRIYVMCDGKLVKELQRGEATEENILFYASAGEEQSS
ncbi:sugar ABC transporter ATP-binding protein [Paenibacillus thermotolerans]|uniref:sugar ABC transporter ATP-binding protein n=1 Tax=Paenibacillus thermotolerans TaxID=3027807 RepID=UPI0023675387|nr:MULTISPECIES: sugar ABC transporter ATP-binding protein [unclassified Paenibacillus]